MTPCIYCGKSVEGDDVCSSCASYDHALTESLYGDEIDAARCDYRDTLPDGV